MIKSGLLGALLILSAGVLAAQAPPSTYPQLLSLFTDWRAFEEPGRLDGGVPDYTPATNARRLAELAKLQARLQAINQSGRSITTWCAPR
jgi:hypothetical protein